LHLSLATTITMETIDTATDSTHHENTACRTRQLWFRKSKSETESLQRGRLTSTGAATTSSRTSHASSSSSTAASGALHQRSAAAHYIVTPANDITPAQ